MGNVVSLSLLLMPSLSVTKLAASSWLVEISTMPALKFVRLTFFVVPVEAPVVSLTSTTGTTSVVAGASVNSVNALIFLLPIGCPFNKSIR